MEYSPVLCKWYSRRWRNGGAEDLAGWSSLLNVSAYILNPSTDGFKPSVLFVLIWATVHPTPQTTVTVLFYLIKHLGHAQLGAKDTYEHDLVSPFFSGELCWNRITTIRWIRLHPHQDIQKLRATQWRYFWNEVNVGCSGDGVDLPQSRRNTHKWLSPPLPWSNTYRAIILTQYPESH